ncbi:single-stranded-DNA-specific exonuclease RecJ [Metabacillus iocasae]|uniref:Single-stranded-DNA-specific exonuclease RecJ n=1 Tax=Priestia iocasae TaxID=2291674 RepID=A0ABS2QPM3_9BACI|nr:single-stranded-DNA-specific exonuclease RecJ [Metabacillus iocasae]MBM7701402.1 single-stranded-DNA-specific exonuclease [Metabacillus iocasae]
MLQSKKRWRVQQTNHELVNELVNELEVTPLIASLLINRGIQTVESAKQFLHVEQQSFHDPFLLDDMDKAVQRIHQAIENGERIMIYGDYDADGVSSTSVMLSALRSAGAHVDFYIPNRFTEGYGPNEEAFRFISDEGYTLVITVDTGISAVAEAELAQSLGFDLIITDHHEPGPVLPPAYAIIHPKKPGSTYPFQELAGVGVAFKLAHALLGELPEYLLELAVIGTIADLVPLVDENRLIASKGLNYLKLSNRPGIKALLKVCSVKRDDINEDTIGFAIGPRINAVGRLQDADPAVDLLMTTNQEEADMLAKEIDSLNKERQQLVNEMTEEAIKAVEEQYPPDQHSVLVITGEGWNAGVVGIVASRLVDRFYRPTIVLSIDREKGIAKGSARSIEGFDLFANLSHCRDILPHFGGHPMAAGMTLNIEDVADLRQRLNELASEVLTEEDFIPITSIDTVCDIEDITIDNIKQLNALAPFGMSNPKPKVLVENVGLSSIRKIGAEQNHLKVVFEDKGLSVDAVGFGLGYIYEQVSPVSKVSFVGELSINEWNNMRKPQLMIEDVAVREWQLFDYRSMRDVKKFLAQPETDTMKILIFNRATLDAYQEALGEKQTIVIESDEQAAMFEGRGENIVFLDMPPSFSAIQNVLQNGMPSRIYALFLTAENHYFDTIPTREHFKWYYAFLAKKSPFDLGRYKEELALHRGWSKDAIDFMSQVFFELEFVTIENGLISLVKNSGKRDLIESATYRKKQEQIEIEKKFIYTSYAQLKEQFNMMQDCALSNEEATN